jgi:hypothetical protein
LWYIPQFPTLFTSWQVATIGGQNEGDPARFSLQAWLFYIRALEGSLLFLPLFVVFLAGLLVLVRNWQTNFPKWTPIVLCVFGGWLGLLFLPNQDPRYAVAALPAVAVITAGLFEGKTRARMALAAFLVLQHILVSFGIPQLPERVVLRKGPEAPVRYDWNLYTQSYFGLWGKPEVQDWKIEHVLRRVSENSPEPAHIALIPDLPRFDVPAFQFTIDRDRYPVSIAYPSSADLSEILKSDFLLMSLGRQAAFGLRAPYAQEINDYILARPDQFPLADSFPLPDGEIIRLYQHARQP